MAMTRPLTMDQIELASAAREPGAGALLRWPDGGSVRRDRHISQLLRQAGPLSPSGRGTVTADAHSAATLSLVEAWQRLVLDGLIVNWPPGDPRYTSEGFGEMFQLTRWGRQVRGRRSDLGALIAARRRLGVELHPHLAERLRDAVSVGAFEQAALLALRAVEARVRELAGGPRGRRGELVIGTALMQHAFGDSGPLADPTRSLASG